MAGSQVNQLKYQLLTRSISLPSLQIISLLHLTYNYCNTLGTPMIQPSSQLNFGYGYGSNAVGYQWVLSRLAYLIIMMSRQGYNQMKTPSFNQENDRDYENTPKFNKSMLKLCPPNSFKTSNTLKLVEGIQPSSVAYKYRAHKFKTQQNSPINKRTTSINTLRLPDLHLGSNTLSKRQPLLKQNQGQIQRDVAKTAIIIDSLIKYLKDQCEPRNHFRQQKRVMHLTEECNEFIELQKTKRSKRPKIVKNQITKKFFQGDKQRERKIYSQDRSRKMNNSSLINQKLGDYTFYGGNTLKMQAEGQRGNKNELNEMKMIKLSRKRFDINDNLV